MPSDLAATLGTHVRRNSLSSTSLGGAGGLLFPEQTMTGSGTLKKAK